jgi:hypothetical protein
MSTSAKRWLDAVGSHLGILDWKLSRVIISTEAAIFAVTIHMRQCTGLLLKKRAQLPHKKTESISGLRKEMVGENEVHMESNHKRRLDLCYWLSGYHFGDSSQ